MEYEQLRYLGPVKVHPPLGYLLYWDFLYQYSLRVIGHPPKDICINPNAVPEHFRKMELEEIKWDQSHRKRTRKQKGIHVSDDVKHTSSVGIKK